VGEKEENKEKLEKIRTKYKKILEQHGAEIKGVYYIARSEPFPSLRENADFSIDTVKASIKDRELKTNHILKLSKRVSLSTNLYQSRREILRILLSNKEYLYPFCPLRLQYTIQTPQEISTLFCHMLHLLSYHLHQMPDELLVQQRMKVWMKLLALQISCMVLIYHKFYLSDRQLPGHWWQ
jgi:hypothetical protein